MVRLCYAIGIDAQLSGSMEEMAKYSKKMTSKQFERLLMLQKFTNASFIKLGRNRESCISSLMNNSTDFSYGYYLLDPDEKYVVHTPYSAVSVEIVSGYDVNQYESDQSIPRESSLGVLKNFTEFKIEVYCYIVILIYALCLLVYGRRCLERRRKKYHRSLIIHFNKWQHLIIGLMLVLILTPFRSVFKSRQIVSVRPDVIQTYQQIMSSGAKLISNEYSTNMSKLLEPIVIKNSSDDLTNKFWRYYRANHLRPGLKKLFTLGPAVVNKTFVYIGTGTLPPSIREIWCSWTTNGHFVRLFVSRDESQREEITGDAFRPQFNDKVFISRVKRMRIARLFYALQTTKPSYYGFERLKKLTSSAHRRKQMELCDDLDLEKYQRHETFSSDFHSFLCTVAFAAFGYTLSVASFVYEKRSGRKVKRSLTLSRLRKNRIADCE